LLLKSVRWNLLARLGPGAFETIGGEVVQAVLLTQTRAPANESFILHGVDVSSTKTAQEKAALLRAGELAAVSQMGQLSNPDARVALVSLAAETFLADIGLYGKGSTTGDSPRFLLEFWQLDALGEDNIPWVDSPRAGDPWSGRSLVTSVPLDNADLRAQLGCWLRGQEVWGRSGVAVNKMKELEPFIYSGEVFDDNVCPIVPKDPKHLPAVWAFVSDPAYRKSVREVDAALKVTAGTLTKVPFDLDHWQQVAAARHPDGLPEPYSDDPTQWLFHGHPQPANDPLQVAVARLAGYRWPGETDTAMELADEARTWIARCEKLTEHTDDDGIVCLPSVRGEAPAHDRLLKLLIATWETVQPGSWKRAVLDKLLADTDCAGKGLDVWLREKFFEQHAKRFHHRPFIWHVWDGLKDGFAALVNYHQLDHKKLERLIHTYLGDWIRQQEAGVRSGVDGAQTRLAAAQDLKRRLELILEGEPPYDIFVRWKKLSEQPIGWNPDLNDGVRLNIRPFMTAEVLRHNKKPKLNITWDKDRGKDVESAPWFKVFKGDRINDHHLTVAEKKKARGESS
jgi:hypothetical protein